MLPWDHWQERWNAALKACIGLGGEIDKLVISEPADDEEIESIEAKLGFRLPLSFREVLLGFSAQVECYWSLPDSLVPPKPLDQIFAGDCSWDLHRILTMQESYHERVKTAFPNTDDPYHKRTCLALGIGQAVRWPPTTEASSHIVAVGSDNPRSSSRVGGRWPARS